MAGVAPDSVTSTVSTSSWFTEKNVGPTPTETSSFGEAANR